LPDCHGGGRKAVKDRKRRVHLRIMGETIMPKNNKRHGLGMPLIAVSNTLGVKKMVHPISRFPVPVPGTGQQLLSPLFGPFLQGP